MNIGQRGLSRSFANRIKHLGPRQDDRHDGRCDTSHHDTPTNAGHEQAGRPRRDHQIGGTEEQRRPRSGHRDDRGGEAGHDEGVASDLAVSRI